MADCITRTASIFMRCCGTKNIMGRLWDSRERRRYESAELLLMPCEILIPAATENVITSRNAGRISARIVCEGANGPTTAFADDILAEKGVFIIPDILANAGE